MYELTDKERDALAYLVTDPDKWWSDAVSKYGENCVRRAQAALDANRAAPEPKGARAIAAHLEARAFLTGQVSLSAEDHAKMALDAKVQRVAETVAAEKAAGTYKTRAERESARPVPVSLTPEQRAALEKVLPADAVDAWAAAKASNGVKSLEDAVANIIAAHP